MYMLSHPDFVRLNYVREQLVLGVAYRPIPDLRFYGEANWAFHVDGGAQPWEFQFGIDYSPSQPNGFWGAPFAAINSKVEEDLNYSGNVTVEAGWQWRGPTGHTFRTSTSSLSARACGTISKRAGFRHAGCEYIIMGTLPVRQDPHQWLL
jgi:hypothetical protein